MDGDFAEGGNGGVDLGRRGEGADAEADGPSRFERADRLVSAGSAMQTGAGLDAEVFVEDHRQVLRIVAANIDAHDPHAPDGVWRRFVAWV